MTIFKNRFDWEAINLNATSPSGDVAGKHAGAVALVVLRSYITDLRRVHSANKAWLGDSAGK